jgi:hypothetical protein
MSEAMPFYATHAYGEAEQPVSPPAFAMSGHEEDRLHSALDALPDQSYREAIEFAPAITAFTRKLATRCARLISSTSAAPVDPLDRLAAAGDLPAHDFWSPRALPARRFDLIVFSDVLSVLGEHELDRVSAYALATLAPRGHCVMVHWLNAPGARLGGDAAAEGLITRAGEALQPLLRRRMPHFRVDVLERV